MDGILGLFVSPDVLWYSFIGVLWGLLIGVIPGVGSALAMSLLLPFTFFLSMEQALVILMSTYTGCLFGGSITSCLLGIPGTGGNIVTMFDGHPMTKQGKAGLAVGISCIASFLGNFLSTLAMLFLAPYFVGFALQFGSHDLFFISLWAIVISVFISPGKLMNNVVAGCIGIILSCIGLDSLYGIQRLSFGSSYLANGVPLVPAIIGIFGFSVIIEDVIDQKDLLTTVRQQTPRLSGFSLVLEPMVIVIIIVSSIIGFIIGVMPGAGTITATLLAYGIFKRFSKRGKEYGHGCYEGVFIAEATNNAEHPGGVLTTVVLGIPGSTELVILLGAFTLHGVRGGPLLLVKNPQYLDMIFVAFMLSGLVSLVVVWITLRVWVKAIETPKVFMWPVILLICMTGAYSVNNDINDVLITFALGVLCTWGERRGFSKVSLVMGLVLGPIMEENLRMALQMSSVLSFFAKPIYLGYWALIVGTAYAFLRGLRQDRAEGETEGVAGG